MTTSIKSFLSVIGFAGRPVGPASLSLVAMLMVWAVAGTPMAQAASSAAASEMAPLKPQPSGHADQAGCPPALSFAKRRLASDELVDLCEAFRGRVLLVVNTASKCAFADQYEGLEALHARYADQGFSVLGFPSNDFGSQEPGSEAQIAGFCRNTYAVDFPMFEKSRVRADVAEPLFRELAAQAGGFPQWNFHKYLINREGRVVRAFSSFTPPQNGAVIKAIEALL